MSVQTSRPYQHASCPSHDLPPSQLFPPIPPSLSLSQSLSLLSIADQHLSHRHIRSVSSLIKVDRQEPVMVLRVDKEKGYIDLSKRRVSEEDIQACEERYNKSKLIHSIMRHVAETMSLDLEARLHTSSLIKVDRLVPVHA